MAFLDDAIRQAQAAVEQKFLFRKIGLPFDYASQADDFPSKAFATAKEARGNLPNPLGLGSGYAYSCQNHSLLFDAYLLRIELGIEAPGDEAILDRLIGGLIRLDTVAPKSFLVGGLAPDGRGFYAMPRPENHAAWTHALHRGLATSAIAPESQEKFRSIAGKWIERVKREKYRLNTVDGKPAPGCDLSQPGPEYGPILLAMLLAAALASRDAKDFELYAATAEEESRARFAPGPSSVTAEALHGLLWRQTSLAVLAASDPDKERAETARRLMHGNALSASPHISAWRRWDSSLAGVDVDLGWRNFPKVPLEQSPYGFSPPESWARLDKEQRLAEGLDAMLIMLLAGDADLAQSHAQEMEECLGTVPWDSLISLNALAPSLSIHARGIELELWDRDLYTSRREPPAAETSFAAKYLEPDYDQANPDKAGHHGPPPGKGPAKTGEANGRKKRKRRRK